MGIFTTHRVLIVEEKDVTKILEVINSHLRSFNRQVGNCGWADEPTKWFVTFDSTDKKWGAICKDIKEFGKIELEVSPGLTTDLYFTRNEET